MSKREQQPSVKQQAEKQAGAYLARTAKQVSADTRGGMTIKHKFQLMKSNRS